MQNRGARGGHSRLHAQQFLARHTRVIVGRLRTVATILRAAAGLDAQQDAALNFVGAMMLAVHELGLKNQLE